MENPLNELIRRAQNLDKNAFGAIYELYVDGIYRYVYYRLFDKKDAEDVTEEVFIKAMTGISGYQADKGLFTGWLYGIARNAVIDYYRSSQREKAAAENMTARQAESLREEPDMFVAEVVRKALAGLTEDQREVIILRYYAGLKISEIAEQMGKPETAVKALQRRASLALAKALGGE
jgi:RNA polymerase sigma-70 factor (ECF subfamily)